MIGMLRGIVWNKEAEKIILDVGGTGYLLHVPAGYYADLRQGEERVFYTYLVVREDDLILFGFKTCEEKSLFIQLLGVSGIGPKAALGILSVFTVKQVKAAIVREDHAFLTEVPGIGAKTAKRLILELKEKIKDFDTEIEDRTITNAPGSSNEALDTLLALGFSRIEAREALDKVTGSREDISVEEQIREALRHLASTK